jgi:hypothetical protein
MRLLVSKDAVYSMLVDHEIRMYEGDASSSDMTPLPDLMKICQSVLKLL